MENNINIEKILPQALDFEKAVLGAILINNKTADEVFSIINAPEVFYKTENQNIFTAIQNLFNAGEPIDMLTVSQKLRFLGLFDTSGGDFYLMQLMQSVSSGAHAEYHARILLQKFMARQTIGFSNKIIALAYDDTTDIFDLLARWQKEFDLVSDFLNSGRTTITFPESLQKLKEEVELLGQNKEEIKLVGAHTGFDRLNRYTGGYRNQDLVIVAARPGMGKTSYVLKCAIENLKLNVGVGFISLEMSIEQLTARAVAIDTNFHLKQLLKTGFEHVEYFNTYTMHQERMNNYPFFIDDSGTTDITDIVITAKLWVRKHNIKVLIIDYLQLMTDRTSKGFNRENEISSISRRLKRLAKELNIPVIALSQLSRAVESRPNKRPMLSDLRESGAIEQDADIVQFLYRPDYYKLDMCADDYDASAHALIHAGANSEVIFAKYRGGSTNTSLLKWVGDKTKFIDVECSADVQSLETMKFEGEPMALPAMNPVDAFDDKDKSDIPF